MNTFLPGQRWISNAESELGLGLVLEADFNRVTVLFLATGDKRVYARDNAPLTRVRFSPGDRIDSVDQVSLIVENVIEQDGLITYQGKNDAGEAVQFDEIELNHHIQFNKPQDRLFAGQIDPVSWFSLRYQTWRRQHQHHQSLVKGLQGGRASLLPHQIYIAQEAANRSAPRIMLADEVGLGKTIEAGLILHHRLINGLSKRVLILVPETLVHQWLVEMLRRFNLRFSIFDEERCQEAHAPNPFVTEQLVLCSQGFFSQYPQRQQQALQADWDMVIVDEAHHLQWNEQHASLEYQFVEQLGRVVASLILLTATPEQLGKKSHFAQLRLLDPDRFYSYEEFVAEQDQFEPVANISKLLLAGEPLNDSAKESLVQLVRADQIEDLLNQLDHPDKADEAREQVIRILLDHHGTGRILFRNSRQTVKGFPEREGYGYALVGEENIDNLSDDPRFQWLLGMIKQLAGQKALLICHHPQMVIDLEKMLRTRAGIAAAVFHEGMTIVERDRAAAYFADEESAARLLICSEIGSEGRNFQFAHHLIMFDLPLSPDLLQQRIGRLDRIGQKKTIQIHVPYIENSEQDRLFHWYQDGLNAFHFNSSSASRVAEILHTELNQFLTATENNFDAFVAKTKVLSEQMEAEMHLGRDQLLELNSCRKDQAQVLIDQLNALDRANEIWPYMDAVFDCYGVDTEYHSKDCYILRPSEHMRLSHFPGLPEDGITITVNREIALVREDLQFMTWEHPMVTAAMDLVLSSETGNATVSVNRHPELKSGQYLLEVLFVAECSAPDHLQMGRFLPPTPIRVLVDQNKQDLTDKIAHDCLVATDDTVDIEQITRFLNSQREEINSILETGEVKAKIMMQNMIAKATENMLSSLTGEIKRLVRLKKVNPSIKDEEIEYLKDNVLLAHQNLQQTQLKLDAVRFIIIN